MSCGGSTYSRGSPGLVVTSRAAAGPRTATAARSTVVVTTAPMSAGVRDGAGPSTVASRSGRRSGGAAVTASAAAARTQ